MIHLTLPMPPSAPADQDRTARLDRIKAQALADHKLAAAKHHVGSWTDDRVEIAVTLWQDGYSASDIAKRLGLTRNAVIGKISRLGLQRRAPGAPATGGVAKGSPKPRRRAKTEEQPRKPRKSKPRAKALEPTTLPEGAPSEPVQVADLTARSCRFPVGDPAKPDFRFCGCRTDKRSDPYCAGHMSTTHSADHHQRKAAAGLNSFLDRVSSRVRAA